MVEMDPIVVSALIGVAGTLLGIVLSLLGSWSSQRSQMKAQIFHDLRKERVEATVRVLSASMEVIKVLGTGLFNGEMDKLIKAHNEVAGRFYKTVSENDIFLDRDFSAICGVFSEVISVFQRIALTGEISERQRFEVHKRLIKTGTNLDEIARRTIGGDYLDNHMKTVVKRRKEIRDLVRQTEQYVLHESGHKESNQKEDLKNN